MLEASINARIYQRIVMGIITSKLCFLIKFFNRSLGFITSFLSQLTAQAAAQSLELHLVPLFARHRM